MSRSLMLYISIDAIIARNRLTRRVVSAHVGVSPPIVEMSFSEGGTLVASESRELETVWFCAST